MGDLRCPRCGWGSLTRLRWFGDYKCGSCGLAFGISAANLWALKQRGRRGELVRDPRSGKLWAETAPTPSPVKVSKRGEGAWELCKTATRRPVDGAGNTHRPTGDPPTERRFLRETEFRPSVSVGDSYSSIQRLHLQLPRHRPTAPKSQRRPFRSAQSRTAIACPCHFLLPENHAQPH